MKIVVVKQAWAWLIVNGHKSIENRTWKTKYRGPLLIQASAHRITAKEYDHHADFAAERGVTLPPPEDLDAGGIVGMVYLVDCVTSDPSPWFEGPVGWKLTEAQVLPFTPCKGMLGIYTAPESLVEAMKRAMPSVRRHQLSLFERGV